MPLSRVPLSGLPACLFVIALSPVDAAPLSGLIIDRFDTAVASTTLPAISAGVLDSNGQPGVQRPLVAPDILGGERDAQFWVGYSEPDGAWTFGVDPDRGLFWSSSPGIHVNMLLEWDGTGDGSTFGPAVPVTPLAADLTPFVALRLMFAQSSAPLQILGALGNRSESASPCGPACGFVSGFSQSAPLLVGASDGPFEVILPFAEFVAPFAPFFPAADRSAVNVINVGIFSAPDVTGNNLVLRTVSLVPVPLPATSGLLAAALAIGAGLDRRRRVFGAR